MRQQQTKQNKMKKIIATFAVVMVIFSASASDTLATYKSLGEKFNIKAFKSDGQTVVIIRARSAEELLVKECGFMLTGSEIADFVTAVQSAKVKYLEWSAVAKENEIKDVAKTIPVDLNTGAYFLYGSEWQFQFSVKITFQFRVFEYKGKILHSLVLKTDELTSSSNQFITMKGLYTIFTSAAEIDDFCKKISPENIEKYFSKPKVEDKFN
jgi:hypothetical protein